MGKQKYLLRVTSLFKESPVVNFSSIERIVKNKKNIKQYTKQLIRNLIKQGKINKLTKGFYTSRDEISLIVFCFKPAYLGLQNAMSFHNLWEQETVPVVITTRNLRVGIRRVFDMNVSIRKIDKKYIFGFEYYKDGEFYFPYSDIEKTFMDMVYFRQPLDEEVINNFREKIDKKKLKSYLEKYPPEFGKIVMNRLNRNKRQA